jgi:hypothetical protein
LIRINLDREQYPGKCFCFEKERITNQIYQSA